MVTCAVCAKPIQHGRLCREHWRESLVSPAARFRGFLPSSDGDGCWLWQGGLDPDGYGIFWVGGTSRRAHRFAWELSNGPIPAGLRVLHRCDVPTCCNPGHLFLGTNADNMRDMVSKDRSLRGSANPRARLTPEIVRDIRDRAASGETYSSIGARYAMERGGVGHVVSRRTWPHIP